MKVAILPANKLINRADVKYNISEDKKDYECWEIKELKNIIVRDPMCYGFQYSHKGIPLIRISDLKQPFIDYSNIAKISVDIHNKFKKTHLEKMDILMSVRGVSIGKIGLFLGEYHEANISPNIIIIRLKDKNIVPYVCMVLISQIGQKQIKKAIAGSSKPTITAPMIEKMKIPIPDDDLLKRINKIFWETVELRNSQDNLLNGAMNLIFEYIGMNFSSKKKLTYLQELDRESRWDAHYHNPGYKHLREHIQSFQYATLGELLEPIDDTIDLKNEKSKVGYIEISDINCINTKIENITKDYIKKLPSGGKIELKILDLLISKVRPYRNCVTLYRENRQYTVTASKNAFSVFRTLDYAYPYYVLAFLRTIFGNNQITMFQSGTSYPTVSDEDVKKIMIPILDDKLMKKINDLYKEYLENIDNQVVGIQKIIECIENQFD